MKKFVITTLVLAASFVANANTILRIGTEASYAPFESIGADNKITGFDIDLANALCKEIKATCQFHNQSFNSLVSDLKFRRIDAAMAAMDVTPDRAKQILFTDTYYLNSALFVAKKREFSAITALNNKRIGVQNGTTHQKYLIDHKFIAVPYDSYQNAIIDLKNGRVDAVFGDTAVINQSLKHEISLEPVGYKIQDKNYFSTGVAIGLRPDNTSLQQELNLALSKIKNDGEYQKIYDKWFQK